MNKVKCASDSLRRMPSMRQRKQWAEGKKTYMRVQRLGDCTPNFTQVLLAVLGKQGRKRRFFSEGSRLIVGGLESVDLPLREMLRRHTRHSDGELTLGGQGKSFLTQDTEAVAYWSISSVSQAV